MAASTPMDATFDMAERLLACVHQQLASTLGGAPARRCVVEGAEVTWDDCECDGGQLTVQLLRTYPADNFPQLKQSGPFTRCEAAWTVAEYVVTILRCVPVQADDGTAPPCADMHEAARGGHQDRWAVRRGVTCCFEAEDPLTAPPRLIQEQLAVGEGGSCAGSELHVFVGFRNCDPCV